MRIPCAILVTLFAISILGLAPGQNARAEESLEVIGGKGDRGEEVRCPAGEHVIGLYGRTGLWIDQIGITCGRFTKPGYKVKSMHRLSPFGGNGGGLNVQDCAPDSAVTGIAITLLEDTEGVFAQLHAKNVVSVGFHCLRPVDGSSAGDLTFGGTYSRATTNVFGKGMLLTHPLTDDCTGSNYATGIIIRFGRYVNAVGLICNSFQAELTISRDPFAHGVSAEHIGLSAGMQDDTDRPGWDYIRFQALDPNPQYCQTACISQRDKCRAWTYVRAGFQGPQAYCYLKSQESPPQPNRCCISGSGAPRPEDPRRRHK